MHGPTKEHDCQSRRQNKKNLINFFGEFGVKSHFPNQPENYHFPSYIPKPYRLKKSTPADALLSIHLQSYDKSHLPSTKNRATLLKPRILPGRSELDQNIEHLPNASSNEKATQITRRRKIIWFNPPFQQKFQNKCRTVLPVTNRQTFPDN